MSRRRRRPLPYSSGEARPFWQRISTAGWLLLGLVVGLGVGLYYAWVVEPVVYTNASPARLSEQEKADYIVLVSQSYAADGNWQRAQQRLAFLENPDLTTTVNTLLESYVRDLAPPDTIRHLAVLAQQLGAQGGAVAIFAPTAGALPTPTLAAPVLASPLPPPTALPTIDPSASLTPTATVPPEATGEFTYNLLSQEQACDQEGTPQIEIVTVDVFAEELPGAAVLVRWDNGEDRFFTGFKPEQGAGYGDFAMMPDVSYTIVLADGSPEVSGLRVEKCADGGDGGWRLRFQLINDRASGRDN